MPGKARWDAEVLLSRSGLKAIPRPLPGGDRLEPKRRAVAVVSVQRGIGVDLRGGKGPSRPSLTDYRPPMDTSKVVQSLSG